MIFRIYCIITDEIMHKWSRIVTLVCSNLISLVGQWDGRKSFLGIRDRSYILHNHNSNCLLIWPFNFAVRSVRRRNKIIHNIFCFYTLIVQSYYRSYWERDRIGNWNCYEQTLITFSTLRSSHQLLKKTALPSPTFTSK